MTMLADRPARRPTSLSPAQQLQSQFAAARVSFTWLGVRKSLSPEQKAQAAERFGAEECFLSATKKLIDTRDPQFQLVSALKSRIQGYWKSLSLPYPEPGLRLLRQDQIQAFDQQMRLFQRELEEAVIQLDEHLESLKVAAQQRLGSLYNPADYPESLRPMFAVAWDFPSVQPPEYLLRLNPQLYQQEHQRMQARFEEAVQLAEQAFIGEFAKLVEHLTERLSGGEDGQKKIFRDSAITNLRQFFDRFRNLSIHSHGELEKLVETAQQAMVGIEPQAVRDSAALRQRIASQLASVQATLDGLLVDQPRRRILRPTREGQG